ncbi:Cysteine synthase family [Klebsormidium nitens]|uniref:Cysteine synthase 1 n=1 Tax=Klebsormidium nitens TaxID=105231 RepID=A0A1Y1HT96_KLENI|nr:Cysteine synthase family [Klebsormidium nitens]|eukprot:GAQ79776.1 Cysteine synthase family [Klebsormidium nitens]
MTSTVASESVTKMHDDKRFKPGAAKPFVGDLGVRQGFLDAIGNTPLIRLKRASEMTGCEIYGKAEFLNPGSSVKDRAALYLIKDAEERGLLKPGGIIVEGTAGNTGIGLALVANARGYKTVIVIPKTQSQEKKDMLLIAGAELVQVPAVPYKNPNNYVKYSGRLAEHLAKTNPGGAIWANQFDNKANRQAHYETTGPEIWAQTEGKVDGFVCAIGTGGTLAGTGKYLKEKNPNIRIGMADPMGASMFNYYANGELKSEGTSLTEGIGQGRVTGNLEGWGQPTREGGVVDFWCQVPDEEALPLIYDLLKEEGLVMGGSTGINIGGAIKLAKELGPGHTIVTILCDYGTRYQGKIYNVDFLKSKNLPYPEWLDTSTKTSQVPSVFVDPEAV